MSVTAEPAPLPRKRNLPRRTKKALRRALMTIGLHTVPYLYLAYMWLVYRTSRVEELGFDPDRARRELGRGVFALWHDEVFFVAYSFGKYRPDTLASQGDSGSIIARMLELCGFHVFRGGSSSGDQRRSVEVLRDMVEHMNAEPGVIYGITTDGSKGPVYRMKRGAAVIAAETGAPLLVEKTWCRRYLRLPTWDGTLVPLPFNHIVHAYAGPIWPCAEAAGNPAELEKLLREVEHELCIVSAFARRRAEGRPPPREWIELFPEHAREAMARADEPALILVGGADRARG